eukprot:SAG31_NODE_1749_length_7358_cov_6.713872_2_plen_242_part_00
MALKAVPTDNNEKFEGSSQYPHKTLHEDMKNYWDFGVSNETMLDFIQFIERMQDWLILAPPKLHTRFLLMALDGGTKLLFRKVLMDKPELRYKEALLWLKANCTSKDSKLALLTQMDSLKMKNFERIQVFLTRATILRVELHDDEQLVKDLWGSDTMIVGDPPPKDGSDLAFGVAIILRPRLRRALRDSRSHVSRIVRAKFDVEPTSVYVVVGYTCATHWHMKLGRVVVQLWQNRPVRLPR